MLQYNCCKTMQMTNFLRNVFENNNKRNTYKLYKANVHESRVGFQTSGNTSLTLMHTVVCSNRRNIHERVMSLIRGTVSLKMKKNTHKKKCVCRIEFE